MKYIVFEVRKVYIKLLKIIEMVYHIGDSIRSKSRQNRKVSLESTDKYQLGQDGSQGSLVTG